MSVVEAIRVNSELNINTNQLETRRMDLNREHNQAMDYKVEQESIMAAEGLQSRIVAAHYHDERDTASPESPNVSNESNDDSDSKSSSNDSDIANSDANNNVNSGDSDDDDSDDSGSDF